MEFCSRVCFVHDIIIVIRLIKIPVFIIKTHQIKIVELKTCFISVVSSSFPHKSNFLVKFYNFNFIVNFFSIMRIRKLVNFIAYKKFWSLSKMYIFVYINNLWLQLYRLHWNTHNIGNEVPKIYHTISTVCNFSKLNSVSYTSLHTSLHKESALFSWITLQYSIEWISYFGKVLSLAIFWGEKNQKQDGLGGYSNKYNVIGFFPSSLTALRESALAQQLQQ